MFVFIMMFFLVGLLLTGLSIPMIQRRVKPNGWYGFRTPKTFSSERIWYAANEYSGRMLFIAGVLNAMAALLFAPLGLIPFIGRDGYVWACTAIMTVTLTWAVIRSFRYLKKL